MVDRARSPVIHLWYGSSQTFGANGQPQPVDNILGDVSDPTGIASLSYSINRGPATALSLGENQLRLVDPGDFNVELAVADLDFGANTLRLVATDLDGNQTTRIVTVKNVNGRPWPTTYTADWSTAGGKVTRIAQVVDGRWEIEPDGSLHNTQGGYDRLVAIGQASTWARYEVTAQVTINAMDPNGGAIGIATGWQGHTTDLNGVPNSDQPSAGHPFPALFEYASRPGQSSSLDIYANTLQHPEQILAVDASGTQLTTGVPYTFKLRVDDNTVGGSHFAFKVWQTGTTEPVDWLLQADGERNRGSILLALHRADASFGVVTVAPLVTGPTLSLKSP